MSRKNVVKTYKMLESEDVSVNITSSTTNVINLDKASIVLEWSGTAPVGTVTIEATNDDPDKSPLWRELDFGSTISISGNTGNHDLIFNELPFRAMRIQYVAGSGTGTLTATLTSKTVGA